MDVMSVANQINARIKRLDEIISGVDSNGKVIGIGLDEAGQKKADAIANYDVSLAVAMAKLIRGAISQIEGETLPDTITASAAEKFAKGLCRKERYELENATNAYKGLLTKIEALEASLNGKQSIFRHLSHEVR